MPASDYIVESLCGEGQFGKVYRGRRKFGSQMVAMKFIGKKGKSPSELASLRQEMSILSSLTECPYVIRMLDWFETASEICVVTEYAQGELFEILEDDSSLPESTVRSVAIQLVQGLRYLHAHRVIHRDCKPQNILIGAGGTLKLCDFGFARSMSANTSLLTSVKGTPLYMAPELVRSMPYDHSCDLWSLGVILYELSVGQPPFFTNSFYTLVHLIVDTPVVYPASMSEEFKSFLQGLLHKSASKRFTWPEILAHPFIRETPEEEARRQAEAERGRRAMYFPPTTTQRRSGDDMAGELAAKGDAAGDHRGATPRGRHAGLGGATALPPKPHTAALPAAQPANAHSASSKAVAHTARGHTTTTAENGAAQSAASSVKSVATAAAAPANGSDVSNEGAQGRSRSHSAELDLRDLPRLLSPACASSLRRTLQQLTSMLQRAASSPQLPSPLLDVYPTLLSEQVPAQLCRLLVSASAGNHLPSIEYATLLPLVLQALVAMVQPSGGKVAPMPLYATDGSEGAGGANGANAGAGGAKATLRAAVGRAPPNLELQLRRQLAECICVVEKGSSGSAFDLFAAATRAACKDTSAALSKRGEPTAALSSLVIVLFQTTRSCVANSAAASGNAAAASAPVSSGGLLDCLARDVPLLTSLLHSLHACAAGLTSSDAISARARCAGRLLLFFANLCGKHHAVVRVLVRDCGFDAPSLARFLTAPDAPGILALPASFLLAQLLSNPHAKMDSLVRAPLPLLHAVASWLGRPASADPASNASVVGASTHASTLLVELEGSGVGYSLLGSHDGLLQILQSVLYFHGLLQQGGANNSAASGSLMCREAAQASEQFLTTTIWQLLLARLEKLESAASPDSALDVHAAGEFSVLGWMSFLCIVPDLLKMHARMTAVRGVSGNANGASATGGASLLTDALFRGICALLSPARVGAIYAWPEACGGGSVGVALLLKRTIAILHMPFIFRLLEPAAQELLQARTQKCLFNCGFVKRVLFACRLLDLPSQWEEPLNILVRLVFLSHNFEKQFVEQGGVALMGQKAMLSPAPRWALVAAAAPASGTTAAVAANGSGLVRVSVPASVLVLMDVMKILCYLVRSSAAHYPLIHAARLYGDLRACLSHSDASVRAKACNVVGNLCRHSAFFYPHLLQADIVPVLVARCAQGEDPAVHKWAAFALGNAVFHDASLCAQASKAIPALLQLLREKDAPAASTGTGADSGASDRTAQNAAGVLTNMLRHGCGAYEMIEQGAVATLLALMEESVGGAEGQSVSRPTALQLQCARRALFTLGDLASFRAARSQLHARGALQRLQRLQAQSGDPKLQTYFQRLEQRYQAPASG